MGFKYLNLKKYRKITTSRKVETPEYPGRRRFIKAMGLGAVAWNPLADSLKSITFDSVKIQLKNNQLKIFRNHALAWEISEKFFEPGYSVTLQQSEKHYSIGAKNLQLKRTQLKFSLKANIDHEAGWWACQFHIPEFQFSWNGNFSHWLEGTQPINGPAHLQHRITGSGSDQEIGLDGRCKLQLQPNWRFTFHSFNQVKFRYNQNLFATSQLVIQPQMEASQSFLKSNAGASTLVLLPAFNSWNDFVAKIHLKEGTLVAMDETQPDICMALPHANPRAKILWVEPADNTISYQPEAFFESQVSFNRFFYYREYASDQSTTAYISGTLASEGLWMTNQLGAFKLENDHQRPVFEAYAKGDLFDNVVLEPRLSAFTPRIAHAVTLASVFHSPQKVLITQPPKNQQQIKVKKQKKQTELKVEFNQLKFKSKDALSIKVLRPEDMVMLEFVFHNFAFTNRGQSPYLELDNAKKDGIVEIYFQSQHTLEEAWFETTAIEDTDPLNPVDTGVQLPAKHLRARKSRLVYELPAGHEGFPLIMEELLNWDKFKLRVHPRAWINPQTIGKIRKPKRIERNKKALPAPNPNLKYLNTPTPGYGLRLARHTRIKANQLEVYNPNEYAKVLAPADLASLKPTFNPRALKLVNWAVAPIPALSTSIEAPALMYISPNQTNGFYHKTGINFRDVSVLKNELTVLNTQLRVLDPLATTEGEIAELWHTRLGVRLNDGKTSGSALPHLKTIRALWADEADPDYRVAKERNFPFMASLDANNRQKLVHTTSNYLAGFEPFPVPVNNLMLTTLGAYLDWHVFFDVPNPWDGPLNIIEWEHIATLGRDHFVKIVEEGYLFPFGHRAAVVKITERKFDPQTKAAANRQRMFVVVLEKEVLYSRYDPNGEFIEFPFQAVRIETTATPNIENPENSTLKVVPSSPEETDEAGNTMLNFYINVGANKGFPFEMAATDMEGHEHFFQMPLVFIESAMARNKSLMQQLIPVYRGEASNDFNKAYNESGFSGQQIAYARDLVEGDTALETERIKFDAQIYPVNGEGELKFHPRMKEASVFIEQINELTGRWEPTTIGLEDDDNQGTIFARVTSNTVVDFSGGSDKSGGFLLPNMAVSGLSKLQGPVKGQLNNLKALRFVPEDFFEELPDLPMGKIFGVISLFDLLGTLELGGTFDAMKTVVQTIREEIDSLKNELLYLENLKQETGQEVEEQLNEKRQALKQKAEELLSALNNAVPRIPNLKTYVTPEALYAEYKWQPQLAGTSMEVIPTLLKVHVTNPSNALTIETIFKKPFDSEEPTSMTGFARFENFRIDIVPLLEVKFIYLEFKTGSSQKTDVKVDLDPDNPVKFKGVLDFVNNLQSLVPSGGFSDDGPYIDLKPTGVTAGFNISVPNVEVGICMISNISLGASVTLPFTGAPLTIGFNFCKRENPFMLTISCFGGGGFFMMVTTLKGIQSIEAAFEFGAAISLNVGVASGGVSAMGGFYYKMEIVEGEESTTLTGYLRLNGHLSILGLISVSLEFYLALNAVLNSSKDKVQKMEGVATLKVKVEVLFFSKTVKVTVRRELKGADADPKFGEMIEPDDWKAYCLAFAS